MYRPRTESTARFVAVVIGAIALGGCSGLYLDSRETIAASGGDAVAANMVAQMVDPWPPHSGNANIPGNGERMQRAVECYRSDKVTTPVDLNTAQTTVTQGASAVAPNNCVGLMVQSVPQATILTPTNSLSGISTAQASPSQ